MSRRRRTRAAIVAAAAHLLASDAAPTVAEIARAAGVSRRTVYMYFPTLEQLLVDAALETVARPEVDAALDALDHADDTHVEHRVEQMARAVQRMSASTEQHGRTLIRLSTEAAPLGAPHVDPPRGYRRVEWIERALEPLRGTLDARRFQRLVSALAMVIGWEALLVQRDIRALGLREAEELSAWAARALVSATLREAAAARGTRRRGATKRKR
jgi:AcrR family transcriptional regulator